MQTFIGFQFTFCGLLLSNFQRKPFAQEMFATLSSNFSGTINLHFSTSLWGGQGRAVLG